MEDVFKLHDPYDKEMNSYGAEELSSHKSTGQFLEEDSSSASAMFRRIDKEDNEESETSVNTAKEHRENTRRVRTSRWDKASSRVDKAVKKLNEEGKKLHGGSITIPEALWRQLKLARARVPLTREQWTIKVLLLQKIIYADKVCCTSTPMSLLERIIWDI